MSCFTTKTYKDRRTFIDSITYLKEDDLKTQGHYGAAKKN